MTRLNLRLHGMLPKLDSWRSFVSSFSNVFQQHWAHYSLRFLLLANRRGIWCGLRFCSPLTSTFNMLCISAHHVRKEWLCHITSKHLFKELRDLWHVCVFKIIISCYILQINFTIYNVNRFIYVSAKNSLFIVPCVSDCCLFAGQNHVSFFTSGIFFFLDRIPPPLQKQRGMHSFALNCTHVHIFK